MSSAPPSSSPVAALPRPVVYGGVVVGVVAVSSAAILIRLADAPALAVAFWRCALGALALAPFALRAARRLPPLDGGQRRQLLGSGALLALHFALFISSLDYTTVASSVLFVAMSPLFVGVGAALLLSEPPSRRTWAGIALAGLGAAVAGLSGLTGAEAGTGRGTAGDLMALGGAVAVAGYLLVGRSARRRLPVSVYAAVVYAVAAVLLLAACLATGAPLGLRGDGAYDAATWAAIAALVAGPQLLGHTVFNGLLSTLSATAVAVAVLAEPVGAGLLAYVVFAEVPGALFIAAAPVVLAGVYLASTPSRAERAAAAG
ncbi:MAG: DMT family transporter [Egibacteraceae bacterium]